jgi:hypothetical protein
MPFGISIRASASLDFRREAPGNVPALWAKIRISARVSIYVKGLKMCILVKFWGGRQVYVERDQWSARGPFVEWRRQGQEFLIWVGRWHIIYTPATWSVPRRPLPDGRVAY